jgi:predicted  nucleic acid-binding Zn-ribbon protein
MDALKDASGTITDQNAYDALEGPYNQAVAAKNNLQDNLDAFEEEITQRKEEQKANEKERRENAEREEI